MCGLVGLYQKEGEALQRIFDGLIQVQHRGQDAGGICTLQSSKINTHKELGLISEIFRNIDIVRYTLNITFEMSYINWI